MRIQTRVASLLILLSMMTLWGCHRVKVVSEYDTARDFSRYLSFALLPVTEPDSFQIRKQDLRILKTAVREEMSLRGYEEVDTLPDLSVQIAIVMDRLTGYRAQGNYFGNAGAAYQMPFGFSTESNSYTEYVYWEGSVSIELIDSKLDTVIWKGAALGEVDGNTPNREKNTRKFTAKMFEQYPVERILP